jgi:hypothetical protein
MHDSNKLTGRPCAIAAIAFISMTFRVGFVGVSSQTIYRSNSELCSHTYKTSTKSVFIDLSKSPCTLQYDQFSIFTNNLNSSTVIN